MNENLVLSNAQGISTAHFSASDDFFYPETDNKLMGESTFHFEAIAEIVKTLQLFFTSRRDVFIAGDLMIYYEPFPLAKHIAPDVSVFFGVENRGRRTYRLWEEKLFPQVVFEIASKSTWQEDLGAKVKLYEQLGALEYYIFDPEGIYLIQPLLAFRLKNSEMQGVEINDGRIFSPMLGLEIIEANANLRFFNPKTQKFLLTMTEMAAEIERLQNLINSLN